MSILKPKRGRPKGSGKYNWDMMASIHFRKLDWQLLKGAHRLLVERHGLKLSFGAWAADVWVKKYRSILKGKEK